MGLKNLTNGDVLRALDLATGKLAGSLDAPQFALLRESFAQLRADMLALQPPDQPESVLAKAAREADARHDALVHELLDFFRAYERRWAGERAEPIAAARRRMLPHGRNTTRRSHADEAAEGPLAAGRLLSDDLELLRSLVFTGGTLHLLYEEWLESCAEIGRILARRAALSRAEAAASDASLIIRNKFAQAVVLLRKLLEFQGAATHPFLEALRAIEAEADARDRTRN